MSIKKRPKAKCCGDPKPTIHHLSMDEWNCARCWNQYIELITAQVKKREEAFVRRPRDTY